MSLLPVKVNNDDNHHWQEVIFWPRNAFFISNIFIQGITNQWNCSTLESCLKHETIPQIDKLHIINYLKDRQQRVVIQVRASERGKIKAGVPQASFLGALLFLVYINEITEDMVSKIRLFADDTSLFINIEDPVSSARLINSDLEKINQWSSHWLV